MTTTSTPPQAFVLLEMMNAMLLVASEAKARGLRVVVLNRNPLNADGVFAVPDGLVDEFVQVESWADTEGTEALVADVHQRYQVVGTYAVFEAALVAEARLRESAGLPTTGVEKTVRVLDKARVRRKLYEEGLSRLRSATLAEALRWQSWPYSGAAVLKPANGTGSALCFVVSSLEELRDAAVRAEAAEVVNPLMRDYILAHGGFVVEEKAEGELLSVESLVDRGRVRVVGLTGRYTLAADPVVEQGLFFPYHHPRAAEIIEQAVAFHHSLGIEHGATHLEVMVPADGDVELIDFNPRFAGFASAVSFSEVFGLPFGAVLADLCCGTEPDLSFMDRPTRFAAEMVVLPAPGATELRDIAFPADAVAARPTKPVGQRLSGRADQLDAVGMFIIVGDTAEQAHTRALCARRETVVNGEPLGDNPNNVVTFSPFVGRDLEPVRQVRG